PAPHAPPRRPRPPPRPMTWQKSGKPSRPPRPPRPPSRPPRPPSQPRKLPSRPRKPPNRLRKPARPLPSKRRTRTRDLDTARDEDMANFTAADVKRLREQTGAGMMDCKNALDEAGGDIEAAIELLRLKGAKDVNKRATRTAANGLVVAG